MDKSKWEYKPFEECIEKSKKTKQLMTSDYQPEGAFPIISQEASLISGYTDDPDYVNHFDRPIVIFGDHTRVLKYVDFDFAVGADGVKILIPHTNLDAKFLLSFLTWYKIPNLGYSRHFKLLKEISVPVPPMEDQQRIVAELDCLNEMIALKQEQLKEFDKLAQSIFYDMFGDIESNSKGFNKSQLGKVCQLKAGKAIKAEELREASEGLYPCFGGNGIRGFIDRFSHEGLFPIIGRQGALCGNINLAKGKFYATEHAVVVTPLVYMDRIWLAFVLQSMHLEKYAHGVAQPGLSVKDLNPLDMITPPLALQQQFAEKISAIEAQKELVKQSIAETQHILDYTMDKYFG